MGRHMGMDELFYLVKAQAAEAVANAAESAIDLRYWEGIAEEYRRLAHVKAAERRAGVHSDPVAN
jgi:hypothetical protein